MTDATRNECLNKQLTQDRDQITGMESPSEKTVLFFFFKVYNKCLVRNVNVLWKNYLTKNIILQATYV